MNRAKQEKNEEKKSGLTLSRENSGASLQLDMFVFN